MTLEELKGAVKSAAAIRWVQRLQPIGGHGDKVFPPTYAGGIYAVENRRIGDNVVCCVLLDSVQSQANRLEALLQDAFLPNWRELATIGEPPECEIPIVAVHVGDRHGWVTSLTAPHRIHDAILRDSEIQETGQEKIRFRASKIGQQIVNSRMYDASAFYKYCPTALLFGTWDSTAGEGLASAKIPRAIVSEIIGMNMTAGVRTGSRIDPLGIARESATIYRKADNLDDWTTDEGLATKDSKGKPVRFGRGPGSGRPAAINHGNVTPDLARFEVSSNEQGRKLRLLPDILESNPVKLRYEVSTADGRLENRLDYDGQTVRIRDGAVKPGGVTIDHALHTWTLSLTQLRRLRFSQFKAPNRVASIEAQNAAARTVLAALAIYGLALQKEHGCWLRSRCDLTPEGKTKLEIVGVDSPDVELSSAEQAKTLLKAALTDAEGLGVCWEKSVVRLTATEELKKLVERSDALQLTEDNETIDPTASDVGSES